MFPKLKRTLIVDNVAKIGNYDVNIFKLQEAKAQESFEEKFFRNNQSIGQREFWLGTSFRFMALLEYMESGQCSSILHLESDSVLLNQEAISDLFLDGSWDLAYPLQADGIGCASILVIRDVLALRKFCEFINKEIAIEFVDDMTLLGRYAKSSNSVKVLPSSFNSGFPYVFDAQSIGRYFLGSDARNMRMPFSRRGLVDERTGSIGNLLPKLDCNVTYRASKEVVLKCNNNQNIVANLHLHSKRIPRSPKKLYNMLRSSLIMRDKWIWKIGLFDHLVFIERSFDFLGKHVSCLRFLKGKRLR